mgnify:CR=1 FL=1
MDAVVQDDAEKGEFMGAVLVARDADILLDKGYGDELVGKIAYGNWLSMIERTIG